MVLNWLIKQEICDFFLNNYMQSHTHKCVHDQSKADTSHASVRQWERSGLTYFPGSSPWTVMNKWEYWIWTRCFLQPIWPTLSCWLVVMTNCVAGDRPVCRLIDNTACLSGWPDWLTYKLLVCSCQDACLTLKPLFTCWVFLRLPAHLTACWLHGNGFLFYISLAISSLAFPFTCHTFFSLHIAVCQVWRWTSYLLWPTKKLCTQFMT